MINKIILGITFINIIVSIASCNFRGSKCDYGEIVTFKINETIKFPDFKLTFTGERKETSKFPNGNTITFTYYDFKINNTSYQKTISWTAGTGDITPLNFDYSGIKYTLELKYREETKTKLDDDELVINKL
jgi:hypothetical protein